MGDTWKTRSIGFNDWSATVSVNLDSGGLDPSLTDLADTNGAALVLHGSTAAGSLATKWSGTALITNIAFSVDLNDVAKAVYSFQGSGTLTEAADTA